MAPELTNEETYYDMEFHECLRRNVCPECGEPLNNDNRDYEHPAYCAHCATDLFDDEEAPRDLQ